MIVFRAFCQVAYKKAVDDTARSFADAEMCLLCHFPFVHQATSPVNEKEKTMIFDLLDESVQR